MIGHLLAFEVIKWHLAVRVHIRHLKREFVRFKYCIPPIFYIIKIIYKYSGAVMFFLLDQSTSEGRCRRYWDIILE